MPYTVYTTDNTPLGTIADGTADLKSLTSLELVGRNYANYGQLMTNNLVSLMDNFAANVAPPNPIDGQLWYSKSDKKLRIYSDLSFKVISGATAQTTAPSPAVAGDIWWNTDTKQLYCRDTTLGWVLVGPERDNTGAKWEQIADTFSSLHTVVSIFVSGTRVAIINKDPEWSPLTTLPGFGSIKIGYNMASPGVFNGTSEDSNKLGGVAASDYFRKNVNESTTGSLTIQNNQGLTLGLNSNLTVSTQTSGNVTFRNHVNLQNIIFQGTVSNQPTDLLTLNSSTLAAAVNNLQVQSTTESTSITTGAARILGGVGVAGRLNVGGRADFTGAVFAPTAPLGTANTMVATTAFVVNNSGFLTNKIYAGGTSTSAETYIDVNDTGVGNARIVIDGVSVATASSTGLNLANGATATTQSDTYNGTGNARIATTAFVKNATQWWGGSKKYVSTAAPQAGVNDVGSVDGDFWFRYTP